MLSRPGRCHSSSLLLGPRLARAHTPSQHACHNRGNPKGWTLASRDQGRSVRADPARTCAYGSVPATSQPFAAVRTAGISDSALREPSDRSDPPSRTPVWVLRVSGDGGLVCVTGSAWHAGP